MRDFIIYLLIGTLFLAACGMPTTPPRGENAPETVQPISTETATMSPTGQVPGEATAAPGEAVIIFHRSGGFAGLDERWLIYLDGQIEGPDGQQRQVEPERVQALLETIQAAGFFDFNDSYVPLDTCCDRFSYTITVQIDGQTKTVSTIDDSPSQPEQLTTVIEAIGDLLINSE